MGLARGAADRPRGQSALPLSGRRISEVSAVAPMIVGVDEAGRGPLAGPVVAAAVILCDGGIDGLDDSKKLSAKRRAELDLQIKARCRWGVGEESLGEKIGRASCRERVCQYGWISLGAVPLKKSHTKQRHPKREAINK